MSEGIAVTQTRLGNRTPRRALLAGALAAGFCLLAALAASQAGAGGFDSASVRGYIVPTASNPDVDPATTCAAPFADNDQSDAQTQSPAGTASNAVTLAACSYDAPPYEGPSTESRPVAFAVISGPGGLLCGSGTQQSQVCALGGINYPPAGEYRVEVNNEAGQPTGQLLVEFCADDPPATGVCGPEDEETTQYAIDWKGAGGGQQCFGQAATIVATSAKTKGTSADDVILGRSGKDKISGKGGKDRICGLAGKDKLKGGPGNDKLDGGAAKDTCKGGPGKDKLKGCEKGGD